VCGACAASVLTFGERLARTKAGKTRRTPDSAGAMDQLVLLDEVADARSFISPRAITLSRFRRQAMGMPCR